MPIIQIVAFRGTGGVINRDSPYFDTEPSLVRAGHVGLQGVISNSIIGFSPTPQAAEMLGGEQALLDTLVRDHIAQPGCLQDDTAVFERAYALITATNGRTTVWMIDVEVSEETLAHIKQWYTQKREALYNLPEQQPPEFQDGEYNCATFPSKLGVTIPIASGRLRLYVEIMKIRGAKRWIPNPQNH